MTKSELIRRTREGLARFAALPVAEQMRRLVANGTIDKNGNVLMGQEEETRNVTANTQPSGPSALHPSVAHVLKFFAFDHLPPHLQEISRPFCVLAETVAHRSPANPETTVALRHLLESKDAAVRAAL